MRPVFVFLLITLCASVAFGQSDTTQPARPTSQPPVLTPGINSPISAPGTLLQSSPDPNAVAPQPTGRRKRRIRSTPPSDPRAFGVALPLGKAKKDSLR